MAVLRNLESVHANDAHARGRTAMQERLHRMFSWVVMIAALIVLAGPPPTALAVATPFTVVALPDTQNYMPLPFIFNKQTQWIVDNQASQNIAFVAHQGDLVETATVADQWTIAATAMYKLDTTSPRLPWGTVPGNHDYTNLAARECAQYDAYFGPSHFSGQSWYGGSFTHNSYQTFQAGGRDYLVLDLEYEAPPSVINWAQTIIDANPGKPTIVNTHTYMVLTGRTTYGDTLWDSLISPNSQIFAVLCGHHPGQYNQTSMNAAGEEVFELLADYQEERRGGDGYLRLYEFDEANSAINVKTFSPYDVGIGGGDGTYKTDPLSQFSLPMNFNDRLGVVPEPSTLVLAVVGLLSLVAAAGLSRRRPLK